MIRRLLTIAVPTYNRKDAVHALISQLVNEEGVEVIILDDGSTDGTYASLSGLSSDRIIIANNPENKGYPASFIRLFFLCRTEYMMVVADDDLIIPGSIQQITNFLSKTKPAFASPIFMRGNEIYRGREKTQKINPSDVRRASAHASGLIYNVNNIKGLLPIIERRAAEQKSEAMVYPQVCILIQLLAQKQRCYYLGVKAVIEGAHLKSGITDTTGLHYSYEVSRIKQRDGFKEFINELRKKRGMIKSVLMQMDKILQHKK